MKKSNYVLLFVLFTIAFCSSHPAKVSAQTLSQKQDSLMMLNLRDLFHDYYRYGKLSDDGFSISEHYVNMFKDLFDPDARVYDFIITDELVQIDKYVDLLTGSYPYGIDFIDVEINTYDVTMVDNQYIVTLNTSMQIVVYTADFEKKEFNNAIEFRIAFDKNISKDSFRILKFDKPWIPPIERLTFDIINVNNRNEKITGIEAKLFIDDKFFDTRHSTNGLVEFFSVPRNSPVKVILSRYESFIPIEPEFFIDPTDPTFDENKTYQLFIKSETEWSRISFTGDFGANLSSIQFSETTLKGSHNISSANSTQAGFSLNIEAHYYPRLSLDKPLELGFGTGVAFSTVGYQTKINRLTQSFNHIDRDNDPVIYFLEGNNVNYEGSIYFLSVPLSFIARYNSNFQYFDVVWLSLKNIYSFPVNSTYSQRGTFTAAGYYQFDDINLFVTDVPYYGYITNPINKSGTLSTSSTVSMLQISAGVEVKTPINFLTATAGISFTTALNPLIDNSKDEKVITTDMISFNDISAYTGKSSYWNAGIRLGVVYRLYR